MTSSTVGNGVGHRTGAALSGAGVTGAWPLVRSVLRRDRALLAAWIVVVALSAVALASAATAAYPTETDQIGVVAEVAGNPALLILRGPVFAPTPGALAAQGFVSSGVLISGLISVLLVIRNTRVEEQTGRRELLGSTVVGRQAPLAAALAVVVAANLVVAALVVPGLLALGLPFAGSVAFGLTLAAGGMVFAGVGALTAQMTDGAAGARVLGVVVLAVTFVVAGIGELTRSGLLWLSPFGWARHTRAFASEQWWTFALFAGLTALLVAAAFALSAGRDVGAGVVPARLGPAVASPSLRSTLALAWRVQRGSVLATTAGFTLLGAALGAALSSAGGLFDTPAYRELAAALGGGDLADLFVGLVLYALAQVAAAFTVTATLRVRTQETAGLADVLLSGPVTRTGWALGDLVVTAAGTATVLTGLGIGAGIGYGDLAILGTTLAYLPSCLVFAGVATVTTGWAPRIAPALTWTLLGLAIALDFLGEFRLVDTAVLRHISPFVATSASVTTASGLTIALATLTAIAAASAGLGLLGLSRRDLDTA